MPTYEYQCSKGHRFEKLQKISDRSRPRCPECGAAAERTISGGAGLHFKGSGFYITDYGKDGKGPRKEAAEKPDSVKADAATEKKPEKPEKPAAKADVKAPKKGAE